MYICDSVLWFTFPSFDDIFYVDFFELSLKMYSLCLLSFATLYFWLVHGKVFTNIKAVLLHVYRAYVCIVVVVAAADCRNSIGYFKNGSK